MADIESPAKSNRGGKRQGAGRKPAAPPLDINPALEHSLSLIETLRRSTKVGKNQYTRLDRYRDFSRVFLGTPEGKRVLGQIVDLLEGPRVTEAELSNHALLAARAWGRMFSGVIVGLAIDPPATDLTSK